MTKNIGKLKMTPEQVLTRTAEMVKYAKQYTSNIEFSCEDATRSDTDFLIQVVNAAVKNGATVINLPDTVGYTTPDEMRKLIKDVMAGVENSDKVEFSVHCHNDLGMAVANSLAGVLGGARQIEWRQSRIPRHYCEVNAIYITGYFILL